MFCYKDKTFCANSDECSNVNCYRYLSKDEETRANAWAKECGLSFTPISLGLFKDACKNYKAIENDKL